MGNKLGCTEALQENFPVEEGLIHREEAHAEDVVEEELQRTKSGILHNNNVYDDYSEVRTVASGAYGVVWEAERKNDGQKVAVKTISVGKSTRHGGVALANTKQKAFDRELAVMLKVNHPNLVKVHACYKREEKSDTTWHFIMDGIFPSPPGPMDTYKLWKTDLLDYVIVNGALDNEKASKLAYQTASALLHLNSFGCIHRDLKPEQILLEDATFRRIRVADYGQARILDEAQDGGGDEGEEKLIRTLTIDGIGSEGYQAPEVVNKLGDYGTPVDMWSLGVVLHLALAKYAPFGLCGNLRPDDAIKGVYAPLEGINARPIWNNVAPQLKQAVTGLLLVMPEDRLTAQDLLDNDFIKAHALCR